MESVQECEALRSCLTLHKGRVIHYRISVVVLLRMLRDFSIIDTLFHATWLFLNITLFTLYIELCPLDHPLYGRPLPLGKGQVEVPYFEVILKCSYKYLLVQVEEFYHGFVEMGEVFPKWLWGTFSNVKKAVAYIFLYRFFLNWCTIFFTRSW